MFPQQKYRLNAKKDNSCENATYLAETGQLNLALKTWALFSAIVNIGAIFGALFGGPFCDYFGRKNGIIINAVVNIIVSILYATCKKIGSIPFFMTIRALHGLVGGIYCAIGPVWLEEVAPIKYRGFFGGSMQFGMTS